MKDFSFWVEYEGAAEGSGRSEKLWLTNPDTGQTGLFKFKKDIETTDHVSECIAHDLANLIGLSCAKFEIGTYKGREGSMSYNIVEHEGMTLIEGIYCISLKYHSFDETLLMDRETGKKYSLDMIKASLKPLGLFNDFLPILIFDFLIGNTDRHQSNWALILEKGIMSISPLYDNSSSLCAYVKESKIKDYLGNDKLLWKSLVDTKSKSLIRIKSNDAKQPTHLTMLKFLQENYYEQTIEFEKKIETVVTEEIIYTILDKYKEVLTEQRKNLIGKFILSKVQLLKEVYGKKEEEYVS
ncbi:MAG: HipA domain-containing protein [Lachnospiraceae bacterium]